MSNGVENVITTHHSQGQQQKSTETEEGGGVKKYSFYLKSFKFFFIFLKPVLGFRDSSVEPRGRTFEIQVQTLYIFGIVYKRNFYPTKKRVQWLKTKHIFFAWQHVHILVGGGYSSS